MNLSETDFDDDDNVYDAVPSDSVAQIGGDYVVGRPSGTNVDAVVDGVNFLHQILVDFLEEDFDEFILRRRVEEESQDSGMNE